MKKLHVATFLLLVIGGLNWGLYAIVGWDVSAWLGGMNSMVARLIYLLVGISAIVEITSHGKNCKVCGIKKENIPAAPSMPDHSGTPIA
jgi:uncharacterized protein